MAVLKKIQRYADKVLSKLRLKPLSLAEKCRLQFGAAVLFSLALALLIPYFWMGKLTEKIALDAGRAVAETVYEMHFQLEGAQPEKQRPLLEESGVVRNVAEASVRWVRFGSEQNEEGRSFAGLTEKQRTKVEELKSHEQMSDFAWIEENDGISRNNYVKIVRATDSCISCHNPDGSSTSTFNRNENIGALVIRTQAREIAQTMFVNRFCIIIAGLLAGVGAMVSFYTIAQRIILRPIRQLRALVTNVSEGNLDARSSIKSGDEYEKLSDAFNHMLDVLQEAQEKLRQANEQLDAKIAQLSDRNIELFKANKVKSEFLANMSHEFRTPLNAILGFAELLREKPVKKSDKTRRYAENIITSGRSLLNMINDLLDLAKAEAGKMVLRVSQTSIQELCEGLVAFFSPLTEQKMIKLRVKVDKDVPIVQTDSGKVQQILYNLLSNAIKFTSEKGKVGVSAKMLDEKMVRITVSDTGPGISEEDQAKIFEKFRQVDGSITREGDGTGLGLAICKQLAELLAGNISLESKAGAGAIFHLDIPVVLAVEQTSVARED